jgi:hypothetical protein
MRLGSVLLAISDCYGVFCFCYRPIDRISLRRPVQEIPTLGDFGIFGIGLESFHQRRLARKMKLMEICSMTRIKCSLLSIMMFQMTAIVTPAFPQGVTQDSGACASSGPRADLETESASSPPQRVIAANRGTADALASVSSGRPWTPGNETATRPWSAPAGHHQPRAIDVLTSDSSFEQIFEAEDARVDRIVRNICRGC